ncbi:MAG: extracellular solute-binding protein [Thermomicrobiales bacterium]|nr:extracellular solute-binding protein [Thermomicrobiales bacterium]
MSENGRFSRRLVLKGAAGTMVLVGLAPVLAPGARAQEPVTLTVWDNWTRDVDDALIEQLDREFMDAHPGVTIDRIAKSFGDLKATAKLAMSSPDGPDLIQINQGMSDMGAMAQAGLLTDLGPYAERYGWLKKLPPSMVARNSLGDDGKQMGEGILYGMPLTAEFVGVYFNRQKLADLGIETPKTMAEFEAALDALLAAGEIPIAFGDLGQDPAIHTYGEIEGLYVDTKYLDDLVYGRPGATFDTPQNVEAAAKLQEWVDKGYFTPDFLGISTEDMAAMFQDGQGATMITGSWFSSMLSEGDPEQFGFFLFPPLEEGTNKPIVAGTSMAYAIRAGSPNPDLAAEYIDWLVSPRAVQGFADNGTVPLGVDADMATPGTLFADIVAAWNHINETDSAGHYLDWATPTFYDTLTASLTELLAGVITPEEFVAKNQADYGAYLAQKEASA